MASTGDQTVYFNRVHYRTLDPPITATGLLPLTTRGDLLSRTDATYSRLGVGADNTVLTADASQATGLRWATPSLNTYRFGFNSTTQATASNTPVALGFNNVTQNNFSTWFVPTTGIYQLSCTATWAANNTGTRYLAITIAGTHLRQVENQPINGSNFVSQTVTALLSLTASQGIEFTVSQNTVGALNIQGNNAYDGDSVPQTFFSILRVA